MLDTLYSYTETSVISGLTIQSSNIFVANGYFSETGLIEHMAQSVALHTGYQFYLKNEAAPIGYIGAISNISIQQLPQLNDKIKTTVTLLQEFAGITLVSLSTQLNDIEIATGQMKTVLAKS